MMKRGVRGLLVCIALALAAYASARGLGWGCPVWRVTGVPCPGCGMSRATVALLRLDFAAALRYHPMVFVLPPVVLYVLFGKKPLLGTKARERALLWGVLALWAGIWIVRLAVRDPLLFAA